MPELPEVETVCRNLNDCIKGKVITKAEVLCQRLRVGSDLSPDFAALLAKHKILGVRRRGKYILIDLDQDLTLLFHLGMTGKLLMQPINKDKAKHDHIIIYLGDSEKLVFNDTRRFGLAEVHNTKDIPFIKHFKNMGAEPLEDSFTGKTLYASLSARKTPIKTALLNQDIVAGLGNIYVCEVLFRTGISPFRPSDKVTLQESDALCLAIKQILTAAIAAGGTTFRDYRHTDGSKGAFVNELMIYGKEKKTCHSCELCSTCKGVEKVTIGGRGTYYCPVRQK